MSNTSLAPTIFESYLIEPNTQSWDYLLSIAVVRPVYVFRPQLTAEQSADGQTGIFHPAGLLALLGSGDRGWTQP